MPITWIVIGILVLIIGTIIASGFVSASPGQIKVVSGPWGQRTIHGKTGWKIPLIERVDVMTASMISVDVRTADFVPTNNYINIKVDAAVKVRIGIDKEELFKAATRNFLYKDTSEIADEVRDTLEGHLRAIIGQMKLEDIVTNRAVFSENVQANATKDLEEMGLEIVAFNIQGLSDANGVIDNLGVDNTETIKKDAAIAKAKATQEVQEQQAVSNKLANDARVKAELEIAEKNTELAKRQAALKVESDTERAKAEAAYNIQAQIQRKSIEIETAEAEIARQEQEAKVKEREVAVKRQALAASVEAEADAQKYAAERNAEAELIRRQKAAEAELFETQKEAEAQERRAEANRRQAEEEAKGIEAKGKAEAEAIRMKLDAEAEGLDKKAEAMKKYGEAAITEMLVNVLPEIAKNVAAPLSNVDKITMYGEGNSGKMVGDIMTSMNQITNGMGLDIKDLIQATLTGRAMGRAQADIIENTDAPFDHE